jgi:hypothetical protein
MEIMVVVQRSIKMLQNTRIRPRCTVVHIPACHKAIRTL